MNVHYDKNSAHSFVVNIYLKKIRKYVAGRYSKVLGYSKRDRVKRCLDKMFQEPEFSKLKTYIRDSRYYDNGNYTELIKKVIDAV